jgi:hypothetical protein
MTNYIQKVYDLLEEELKMGGTDYQDLQEVYALLVMTVGVNCKKKHVHDAWSVWQNRTQPNHRSLIPFEDLTKEVQELDEPYRLAIIKVAQALTQPNNPKA